MKCGLRQCLGEKNLSYTLVKTDLYESLDESLFLWHILAKQIPVMLQVESNDLLYLFIFITRI